MACRAASWATCWAAKAVLLREPLKPTRPALDQPSTLPCISVMLTLVLLKVAKILAMPTAMFFEPLALTIFLALGSSPSNSAAVGAGGMTGSAVLPASAAAGAPAAAGALAAAGAPAAAGALAGAASFFAASSAPAGGASGLCFFSGAGFLGCCSSAIVQKISGCRSWRWDCAARRRSCAGLCGCGRWWRCAARGPAAREDGEFHDNI